FGITARPACCPRCEQERAGIVGPEIKAFLQMADGLRVVVACQLRPAGAEMIPESQTGADPFKTQSGEAEHHDNSPKLPAPDAPVHGCLQTSRATGCGAGSLIAGFGQERELSLRSIARGNRCRHAFPLQEV